LSTKRVAALRRKIASFELDAIWLAVGRRDDGAVAQDVFEQNQDQFRMAGWLKTCTAEKM
jgi:hypothetical protein